MPVTTNASLIRKSGAVFNVPFGSASGAVAAQGALDAAGTLLASGAMDEAVWPGGFGVVSPPVLPATTTVAIITVASVSNLGVLPDSATLLLNTSPSVTAVIGGRDATVLSAAGGTFIYQNTSAHGEIFLGGGINYIKQAFSTSAAVINIDGGTVLGGGAAIIDGALGASTVNVFANALINLIAGGQNSVVAQPGTVAVGVSGASTVAATVAGTAGSLLLYIPDGGNAFITPGAGNAILLDHPGGGSETLFGGAATVGGVALAAPSFTGSATVFGGTGYFQGGTAGGNILISSTVPGATTLMGGASGDALTSFGVGNTLIAGPGNETLVSATGAPLLGNPTVNAPSGGVIFILGSGDANVFGSPMGGDTIYAGSGASSIRIGASLVAPTIPGVVRSAVVNTIYETAPGGNATVGVWFNGLEETGNTDMYVMLPGVTATIDNSNFLFSGGGFSVAHLSDGTTIQFALPLHPVVANGATLY